MRSRKRSSGANDGGLQALDHAANWVRFADTKATIFMAALGVVTTLLVSNGATVVAAATTSEAVAIALTTAAAAAGALFLVTLYWLVNAIIPRSGTDGSLNRFSWPSLVHADFETLNDHTAVTSARDDALRQALTLARVAEVKFDACRRAGLAFAGFIIVAVGMLVAATVYSPLS
jgi:hypothetical protein